MIQGTDFSCTPDRLTRFNKAYLVSYFSRYKTKLVDPWVRQKRDLHVLQNTGSNGRDVTLLFSMTSQTSQNYVKIKMADANAKYFKVNLILIHVSPPIGVQEKESIMSVTRVTVWF